MLIMPYILVFTKILLLVCAVVFTWNGFEELFIDIYWICRTLYRKLYVMKRYKPLEEEQLLAVPEKPVAILIPCWDESAVIGNMLKNTLNTLNYSNYTIFVGSYLNDPETRREVDIIREQYDNVERVICPREGPTNKADCLNWVLKGIQLYEQENNMRFEIFVIEDAEDILHPLALKLFNYLIPRKDMIQLPVFPIPGKWYEFTRNHYLDEFAENHTRDMVVREALAQKLPSAGVGTALSRKTIDILRKKNRDQIFNVDSLAEDYELGLELGKYDLKQVFVRKAIVRKVTSVTNGRVREKKKREYIAIHEYFPKKFTDSVRQKSRWVVGIALQGWAFLGWYGSFINKFMLYRDRKSLITNQINLLGNLLAIFISFFLLYQWMIPDAYHYPPLVPRDSILWILLWINLFFLCWRIIWRVCCVWHLYGPLQAILAVPRLVWSNFVNFCATLRAIRVYARYKITGEIIPWDKTQHVYPTVEELKAYRKRLGDLLLERRFVTVSQLEKALALQKETGQLLGRILLEMNAVSPDELLQALGQQFRMETAEIDPYETPVEVLKLFPKKLAVKYNVFPMGLTEDGKLIIGAETLLRRDILSELENEIGRPITTRLVTRGDLAFAIRRGYQRLEKEASRPLLGELVLRSGKARQESLDKAAKKQRESYRRLGEILVEEGLIDDKEFASALQKYVETSMEKIPLGEFLVQEGLIKREDLLRALKTQENLTPKFGRILVEMGEISETDLEQILREQQDD